MAETACNIAAPRTAKPNLILAALADIIRSRSELIAENAFLRQQLIVLQRQTKRPVLTPQDRTTLVLLASRLRTWREALLIVKPEIMRLREMKTAPPLVQAIQQVVKLRAQGYSYPAIAHQLGISVGTAWNLAKNTQPL